LTSFLLLLLFLSVGAAREGYALGSREIPVTTYDGTAGSWQWSFSTGKMTASIGDLRLGYCFCCAILVPMRGSVEKSFAGYGWVGCVGDNGSRGDGVDYEIKLLNTAKKMRKSQNVVLTTFLFYCKYCILFSCT
jgi:hypothetical protein